MAPGQRIKEESKMQTQKIQLKEWEQVEIERSAKAASLIDESNLRMAESVIKRYLSPPADTCFALEYAYHLLGDVKGKVVVDLGCGSGDDAVILALRGAQVQAVDISPELINLARRRVAINGVAEGTSFFVCSAYELPFPDESVDVVFGMAILHHLELSLAAREVRRLLHPGGRAIFLEPVRNSKLIRFVRSLIPYRSPNVSPFERPLTDREMKEFASGYSEYHSKAFELPYFSLARRLPVVRDHLSLLCRWDQSLLNLVPALRFYSSVRVVEMIK